MSEEPNFLKESSNEAGQWSKTPPHGTGVQIQLHQHRQQGRQTGCNSARSKR